MSSTITSSDLIQLGLCEANVSIPEHIPLCKSHYHMAKNRQAKSQTHCPTCKISLRNSSVRVCPDSDRINRHLLLTGGEGSLSRDSQVCFACYKSQLQILKDMDMSPESTDSDLSTLICRLQESCPKVSDPTDIVDAAMHKTIIHVAEMLLEGECLLLPSIHAFFNRSVEATSSVLRCESDDIINSITSRWILSNLTSALSPHLNCACKVRKHGTIIYRKNGDLLLCLSKVLYKQHTATEPKTQPTQSETQSTHQCEIQSLQSSPVSSATKVAQSVNACIRKQIQKYLVEDKIVPFKFDELNIDQFIKNMDASIWSFIVELTKSITEQEGRSKVCDTDSRAYCLKKLRRFTCICMLMFCIDDRCYMPLHNLITDMIDSYGGSIVLIRSLNRLGICGCQDTLERSIQHRVDHRKKVGPEKELESAFTIVSADNIDFLHSYARNFHGQQNKSWLGTTVQMVQPQPSVLLGTPEAGTKRPHPSPQKPCQSPLPKIKRRARSGIANAHAPVQTDKQHALPANVTSSQSWRKLVMSDFDTSPAEQKALDSLKQEFCTYQFQKHIYGQTNGNASKAFVDLKQYLTMAKPIQVEESKVVYLDVLDAVADSKDTLLDLLNDLHSRFIEGQNMKHILVEGDAKLYEVLQSIKFEYGNEFSWLLTMPGDWHLLKNFQIALMKPYYEAGLKELARASGYSIAAIQACSKFKRTHYFILEVWEALYQVMVKKYFDFTQDEACPGLYNQEIISVVQGALEKIDSQGYNPTTNIKELQASFDSLDVCGSFTFFVAQASSTNSTWKFWSQFVLKDALCYIGLFIAIRSANWDLRMASIKLMASVFSAFDHLTYKKLIAQHLADVLIFPEPILDQLRQGCFTVSLTGQPWRSVGVDEAHEMEINEDCKHSIVHPSPDYISRVTNYLPYRAKSLQNIQAQLFPEELKLKRKKPPNPESVLSSKHIHKKITTNITQQTKSIELCGLLATTENTDLTNPLCKKNPSPDQTHDLLHFRAIGQEEFDKYIEYYVIAKASVHPPQRKRKLRTFADKKINKRALSQLQKDLKLVQTCLHKKLLWSKISQQPVTSISDQYIPLPLALCTNDGKPLKGQKSYATKTLETRYQRASPEVILHGLPEGWIPECCILEGMFMLNTTPLGKHKTFADYGDFLLQRFVVPQWSRGAREVHVIFDVPGRLNTPKKFEQDRRDTDATVLASHVCSDITSTRQVPSKQWRENIINCRTCKRNLTIFLTQHFLHAHWLHKFMSPNKLLMVAGGFTGNIVDTAWSVNYEATTPQPNPVYTCNCEETDTRMWLHVRHTACNRVLIMSLDTDSYHIGLPLHHGDRKEVIVQLNKYTSKDLRYFHLNHFLRVIKNDPDLSSIPSTLLPKIFQTLFVSTGSDYTSFFSRIGKALFYRYFFQHARFITSGKESRTPGTLADVSVSGGMDTGFLAFLRLIGVVYFKKRNSAFTHATPESHFNSYTDSDLPIIDQHKHWLDNIRLNVGDRSLSENEKLPSTEALYRHWKRSCWVLDMWAQANENTISVQQLSNFGWKVDKDTLTIDWDSEENAKTVAERVSNLLKGCKCKTGCRTNRCGCRKNGEKCSVGCECSNSNNLSSSQSAPGHQVQDEDHYQDQDSHDQDHDQGQEDQDHDQDHLLDEYLQEVADEEDESIDDVMDWVFGPEDEY